MGNAGSGSDVAAPPPIRHARHGMLAAAGAVLPQGAWLAAGSLIGVLLAFAGRFGFHRDELYFVEAGRHPAWGYPDQPPLVPLVARAWYDATGGWLLTFRILPAVLAGAVVLVAGLISRQLGGSSRDQVGVAVATACSAFVVAVGHLFSTTTFDLLGTAVVLLLLLRALDRPPGADLTAWLWAGLAAGVTLQVKTLLITVLAAALIGLLAVGPRAPLSRPGPWLGALAAALVAAPNLAWQAANGWPQLELGRQIAAGSSTTSVDRPWLVPLQVLIVGPIIGIVVVVGLVMLLRSPRLRPHRWLGVAYLTQLVITVATGGKPYYTGGFLLVLIAAGIPPLLDRASSSRALTVATGVALAAHVAATAIITLPLTSPGSAVTAFANDVNPDLGETVGWDRYVAAVSQVAVQIPARERSTAAVLTSDYAEAGPLDRARDQGLDLPAVYSGHNGYGYWGPPPQTVTTVVLVGWTTGPEPGQWFQRCRQAATVDNGVGLDNEEQGTPVRICTGPTRAWADLWPEIRHLS